LTSDVYFVRTNEILEALDLADTHVVAEIFPRRSGYLCGMEESIRLLRGKGVKVFGLPEGEPFDSGEVIMRLEGPYGSFGIYETAPLGDPGQLLRPGRRMLGNVWKRPGDQTSSLLGARHVHPAVAPVMERAAVIGGATGASCILGAKLAGFEPVGTVPHALFLIVGDTVAGAPGLPPAHAPRRPPHHSR
jgi:nicotinate phosphoribosyltransferase